MQRLAITIAVGIGCLQATAVADDLQSYLNQNPFELSTAEKQEAAIYSYDSPLYRGLWPMTIDAFKRSDWAGGREMRFEFPIEGVSDGQFLLASDHSQSLGDALWPMKTEAFEQSGLHFVGFNR